MTADDTTPQDRTSAPSPPGPRGGRLGRHHYDRITQGFGPPDGATGPDRWNNRHHPAPSKETP